MSESLNIAVKPGCDPLAEHTNSIYGRWTRASGQICVCLGAFPCIYANSEPQPNAKYSCAASVAIAR